MDREEDIRLTTGGGYNGSVVVVPTRNRAQIAMNAIRSVVDQPVDNVQILVSDNSTSERDREVTTRTQADTEFLARELASVRVSLSDVVTMSDLRETTDRLTDALERIETRLRDLEVDEDQPAP